MDGVVGCRWEVSPRGKLNLRDVVVGPSSDCIPIKHLVGVRRLSCDIDQLDSADYQALLPSGEISSAPCCSFSSSTFLVVDSRFLNQILSVLEIKTNLVGSPGWQVTEKKWLIWSSSVRWCWAGTKLSM